MAVTVAEAIRAAAERLAATSDTARLDAEWLMAHALGTDRSALLLSRTRDPAPPGFDALVERRARHEPVAYILGHQDFWGLRLAVGPGVLIPRGDSEAVVRAALAARPDARRVLDLGTGSGALLLALLSELPGAEGVGVDTSPQALAAAAANADALGLGDRARIVAANWHNREEIARHGQFDLVVANPPYVEEAAALAPSVRAYEPASALFAGAEGLDDYRVLVPQLRALLAPAGVAVLEIGYRQGAAVAALARAAGFAVTVGPDLAGRDRVVVCK